MRLREGSIGSTWLAVTSLVLFFLLYSLDFYAIFNFTDLGDKIRYDQLGVAQFSIDSADASEEIKKRAGLLFYFTALLLLLGNPRVTYRFCKENLELLAVLVLILATVYASSIPVKVLTNVIQLILGIVVAIVLAEKVSKSHSALWLICLAIAAPIFIVHLVSVWKFFSTEGDFLGFVETQRYGGLSGNPNTAGAQAVVGLVTTLFLMTLSSASRIQKICLAIVAATFVISLILSGSATSAFVLLAAVSVIAFLLLYSSFSPFYRVVFLLISLLSLLAASGYFINSYSFDVAQRGLTTALGKEDTFSGRTELWASAVEAVKEKPLAGWGYDSHRSVMAERRFSYDYNHYHNGFLDTAVAGGVPLLLAVLLFLVRSALRVDSSSSGSREYILIVVPLIILVLFNLTEYSVFRPLNIIFQFFICFYAFTYYTNKHSRARSEV